MKVVWSSIYIIIDPWPRAGWLGLLLIYIKEMFWRIRRRKPTTLKQAEGLVWFASDFRFLGSVGLCHAQGGLEFLSHNRKKEKKSCADRTLQQSAAGVCGEPILCVCMCVGDPNALHPPWGPGLQVQALLIMVTGRIHRWSNPSIYRQWKWV